MEISEKEYEELVKVIQDKSNQKWSTVKLIKGKLNNKFIAFSVTTLLVWRVLRSSLLTTLQSSVFEIGLMAVWGIAVIVYMLSGAIDTAVSNMQLKAQVKFGTQLTAGKQKTTTTDTAQVLRAAQEGKGG